MSKAVKTEWIKRNCKCCNTEFRLTARDAARKKGEFCSPKCRGIILRGELNHSFKGSKNKTCPVCEKLFVVPLHKERQVHCSVDCSAVSRRKIKYCQVCSNVILGDGKWFCSRQCSGRHQSTKIQKNCKYCLKSFTVCRAVDSYGFGVFCSSKCMGAYRSANPSSSAYNGRGGKRSDLQNIYFRSSWEANWARYLNYKIESGEVKSWKYESKTYRLTFLGIDTFYTPDFEVELPNGNIEFHEVKGYLTEQAKTKLDLMAVLYPSVKIVVIDKPVYTKIFEQYSLMIPGWENHPKWKNLRLKYQTCENCQLNKTWSKHGWCGKCQNTDRWKFILAKKRKAKNVAITTGG